MLKSLIRLASLLIIVFTIVTCIEPYFPKLSSDRKILVVEGQITNDNRSYLIKLSLSKQNNDSITTGVQDAIVYITDEHGTKSNLKEVIPGIYRTDSLNFIGETGKSYQLHIKTSNGNEYASDTCQMMPVTEIDTIYFEKDEQFLSNQTVARKGISIYLDSKPGLGDSYYLRWDFNETWKFRVPYPSVFHFFNQDSVIPLSPSETYETCYKKSSSSNINTGEVLQGITNGIKKVPLQFIGTDESDRLTMRYCIQINQYSISQKEFKFWNDLKKMNETEGDIFGSQPFAVLCNVRNINDPYEPVLGYFSVSAVIHKTKFIDFMDIVSLGLPFYHHSCPRIAKSPRDYQGPWGPPVTFDDVYRIFMSTPGYAFVEPVTNQQSGALFQLVFTATECADCRITGSVKKPDYWFD
jgi:hypothetical protein